MLRKLTIFAAVVLAILFTYVFAAARDCVVFNGPRPQLEAIEAAANIFTARVEEYRSGADPMGPVARLTVLKVYKGGLKSGDTVFMGHDGGFTECSIQFPNWEAVGRDVLYYLDPARKDGVFANNVIPRTGYVYNTGADINFLENYETNRNRRRVFGYIRATLIPPPKPTGFPGFEGLPLDPLISYSIHHRKSGKIVGNTQSKRFFEAYDLKPGEYILSVSPREGYIPELKKLGGPNLSEPIPFTTPSTEPRVKGRSIYPGAWPGTREFVFKVGKEPEIEFEITLRPGKQE